jgi:hypothetical protein
LVNDGTYFSARFTNNVEIFNDFYCGCGIGFDQFSEGGGIPVYLDFRSYFTHAKFKPFVSIDLGFAFGWSTAERNGVVYFTSLP